ncbi:MAG: CapA family protein, partial [Myxococcota bacterium]
IAYNRVMRPSIWLAATLVLGCGGEREAPPPSPAPVAEAAASTPSSSALAPTASPSVRLAFVGDLCMSLKVGVQLSRRFHGQKSAPHVGPHYPFDHVQPRLRDADLLVGNLECVAGSGGEISVAHHPFRCGPRTPELLLREGFDLVSVANNHARDFGDRGLYGMVRKLDEVGLAHVGRESHVRQPMAPSIHVLDGLRVGVLAYYFSPQSMRDVVAARPHVDFLAVFMHWGIENERDVHPHQRKLAHDFIDHGVDLVVGAHTHVIQPTEWYRERFIAYGLGNFVFSGMTDTEAHQLGALLEVDVDLATKKASPRMTRIRLDYDGVPHWEDEPDDSPVLSPPS